MKKLIAILLFFICGLAIAQPSYNMNNTPVTVVCGTNLFYDSGGSGGSYANNENFTKTFTAPAGFCLNVSIANVNIEACCDILKIFDGPNGASPLMGTLAGVAAGPFNYLATGSSITFSFTSDGSVVGAGWQATITCQAACSSAPCPGSISASAVCPLGGPFTLSSAGACGGCGTTQQWQSAPTPTGPWTNITGATGFTYAGSYSVTTYYRRVASCGALSSVTNTLALTASTISCALSSYVSSPTAYSWDNFVGTVCASTDDVIYNNIAMTGFPFCFAGSQYWGGYIASNGAFVFPGVPCFPNIQVATYAAPGIATGWSIGAAAPVNGTSIPRNAILGPWHDIDPSLGGVIRYIIIGAAPNRRFVVSYENIPMFSCGVAGGAAQFFSGQIKLFETTNAIEIHIKNKQLCTTWNGGNAVMGLHSYDGLTYIPPVNMVNHNFPTQWTMTNTAYRFTAPCAAAPCLVLPLHFKSFYAERVDAVNHLYWETSEEENIKTFIIERSTDAQNFNEIARVNPRNSPSKYEYIDEFAMPGVLNYYRITSFEKNGNRNSTEIYPLGANEGEISVSSIFPNPARTDVTLTIDSKIKTTVTITIYNALGNSVKSFSHDVSTGGFKLNLYLGDIEPGIYIIETTTPKKEVVSKQKLIKVN